MANEIKYKFIIPCANDVTDPADPRSFEKCFLYDRKRIADSDYKDLMCSEVLMLINADAENFDFFEELANRNLNCDGDIRRAKKLYEETAAIDMNCGSLERFYGFPY